MVLSASLPPAITAAALYLLARENNVPLDQIRGSVIQAPFYAEDCGYAVHMPFRLRLRLAANCIEFCSKEMPRFHSFVEDTYFFNQAGLNAADEMALGFIEIRYLVRELLKQGMDIESSFRLVSLSWSTATWIFLRRSPRSGPPGACLPG